MKTAIQLWTLRDLDEPLTETVARVGETGFQGVEFAGLGDATPDEVTAALDDAGLDAASAHVPIGTLEGEFDDTVETYRALGVDRLVVPSYEREAFTTPEGVTDAARRFAELGARYGEEGFEVLYHNHTFEFVDLDGGSAFERVADLTEDGLGLQIDTGLATHGGADPVDLLERYGDRVPLVHLTDTRSDSEDTHHVDLGEGEVDLRACVDAAERAGVDWLIFENGRTDDPVASMRNADRIVRDLLDR